MKKKSKATIVAASVFIVILSLLIYGQYYLSTLLLTGLTYLIKEAFWSDHIFYDVKKDQDCTFSQAETYDITIKNNSIKLPEEVSNNNHSLFLEVDVRANIYGHLFDPVITVQSPLNNNQSQYFEKGAKGKRYLNITHSVPEQDNEILLKCSYCSLASKDIKLIAYKKPDLEGKKILVISPHPDDAEIAAFSTYSKASSFIVTISAGEKEAENLSNLTGSHIHPEIVKGRLRAHDSVMAPMWAGKSVKGAVNLGYFDDSLKSMFENKKKAIQRNYSNTTLPFREFNSVKLKSDKHGSANWYSLVEDLTEILSSFKPDIVITPDLELDSHIDHHYATVAVKEAVEASNVKNIQYLYYSNHLNNTDMWPFGPAGSLASLPPINTLYNGIISFEVNRIQQINKSCVLEMMHDLRSSKSLKINLRYHFQRLLAGRSLPYFGAESYYRKNVKSNEIFFFDETK